MASAVLEIEEYVASVINMSTVLIVRVGNRIDLHCRSIILPLSSTGMLRYCRQSTSELIRILKTEPRIIGLSKRCTHPAWSTGPRLSNLQRAQELFIQLI